MEYFITNKEVWSRKMARLAIAPVRELMGEAGAKLVSKEAVLKVVEYLEAEIDTVTKSAWSFCKHAGRKKIMIGDINLAIQHK